jgi:hypothetical protein
LAESKDISHLMRRLFGAFHTQARPVEGLEELKSQNKSISVCLFGLSA